MHFLFCMKEQPFEKVSFSVITLDLREAGQRQEDKTVSLQLLLNLFL